MLGKRRNVRIVLVDDHPLVRQGLKSLIGRHPDMDVCGEATDVREAVELVGQVQPDVAIVDISLKDSSGMDLIGRLKDRHSSVRVVVSSMHDEVVYAERALQAGAMGYVHKQRGSESIIDAIRAVMQDRIFVSEEVSNRVLSRAAGQGSTLQQSPIATLSNRELQVFELLGQGLSTRKIAAQLHVSSKTVDTHRQGIKLKLALDDDAQLRQYAAQWTISEQRPAPC